jgi:hypothetical protein
MQLTDFECPNCGASDIITTAEETLRCAYCDSFLGDALRVCLKCGHYNEDGARHCSLCGTRIVRECPVCGAGNWVLSDHCVRCGRNLNLIEEMVRRWQVTTQQRLHEQRQVVRSIKKQEEQASQARMATIMETERQRQAALVAQREYQRQRDRQMLMIIGLVAVGFVMVVLLVLVVGAVGR